ncbi:MAG: bifunctional 4'-phosphopantothenoylcysteine decarboxylase/phosphopantothenoylcysteine synthetase [Gammaproteobacteria bacterium]|nr:MAG: bifunctional 4'-phosphopantothenoylcysteine decarboxylase/phosphopantothenoylcysteine synthetase [Gammaproteobacteria bacterium]PIE37207.1 MAG: bifunctional 4'-phosphopantothenoylcysteine decarboxylase/phosphopantothenoylcysteine synthetase [Gammaproteobacteria bacterium]
MSELRNKRVLLGISGGIAAYKSAVIARHLVRAGAEVRTVMTEGARAFLQPLSLQALTGHPVHTELLDAEAEAGMGHIELARWAELVLIAPATANTMARLANGFASDLLSTIYLATDAPVIIAPAMNRLMWQHAATQSNRQRLIEHGVMVIGPGSGLQACGETGDGRMLEPEQIVASLELHLERSPFRGSAERAIDPEADTRIGTQHLPRKEQAPELGVPAMLRDPRLKGRDILITAGPTREPIDPVRYISNRSSGKMGYAIARMARAHGASVTLVSGPTRLDPPDGVKRVDVTTAQEMYDAVLERAAQADIFISVAAVSDFRVESIADRKIKKTEGNDELNLMLVRNPDILATVAALPKRPFCVGFAAETHDVEAHARGKLERKKLDMIAANHVARADNPVFASDRNALDVYWASGKAAIGPGHKLDVAAELVELVAERFAASRSAAGT